MNTFLKKTHSLTTIILILSSLLIGIEPFCIFNYCTPDTDLETRLSHANTMTRITRIAEEENRQILDLNQQLNDGILDAIEEGQQNFTTERHEFRVLLDWSTNCTCLQLLANATKKLNRTQDYFNSFQDYDVLRNESQVIKVTENVTRTAKESMEIKESCVRVECRQQVARFRTIILANRREYSVVVNETMSRFNESLREHLQEARGVMKREKGRFVKCINNQHFGAIREIEHKDNS